MSDKGGWSEKVQGFFGEYVQHYDADGNKVGYSEEVSGFTGDYTQHYDQAGDKAGYSEESSGFFGNEYTQHYDRDSEKSGHSEETSGLLSNPYTQHYDRDGGDAGYSERTPGFLGGRYTQHYGRAGTRAGREVTESPALSTGEATRGEPYEASSGSISSERSSVGGHGSTSAIGQGVVVVALVLGVVALVANGSLVSSLISDGLRSASSTLRVAVGAPHTSGISSTDRVTMQGIAGLRVGMTIRQAEQALGQPLPVTSDASPTDDNACFYVSPPGFAKSIGLMVTRGTIARVDIWDRAFLSRSGVRVGDSEATVRTVYGNRLTVEPHKYEERGHYMIVTPTDSADLQFRMLFETDGSVVTRFRGGRIPEVFYVEGCA